MDASIPLNLPDIPASTVSTQHRPSSSASTGTPVASGSAAVPSNSASSAAAKSARSLAVRGSDAARRSKELVTAQRLVERQAFNAEVTRFFEDREAKVQELHKRFPGKSEKVIRKLLSNESTFSSKRAPNLYNAYLHEVSSRHKEDGMVSRRTSELQI